MRRLLFILAFLLCAGSAYGQTQVARQPDCVLPFYFSTTGNAGTLAMPGSTAAFDNRAKNCTLWTLTYAVTGLSALSIEFDGAPDSNGAAGSFTTWSNLLSGSLPLTSTTYTQVSGYGYAPWLEVTVNSKTGTGQVTGALIGFQNQNVDASTGYQNVNCKTGCASASDTVGATVAMNANNVRASVALSGQNGSLFNLAAGTLSASLTPQCSMDGGVTWINTGYTNLYPTFGLVVEQTLNVTSPNAATSIDVLCPGSATHAGMQITSYTSGTANGNLRATANNYISQLAGVNSLSPSLPDLLQTDGGGRLGVLAYGQQGGVNSVPVTVDTNGRLYTQAAVGAGNNVSLDSNGFLIAGSDYAGTPLKRYLKVDSSGNAQVAVTNTPTVTANAGTGNFTVVQPTGSNLHVQCDSGCTPGGSFSDNSAFTFGSTAINNTGYVVNDPSSSTVAQGSSGTARMSSSRIAFASPADPTGNPYGSVANPLNVAIAAQKDLAASVPGASPANSELVAAKYSNLVSPLKPGQTIPVQVDSYGRALVNVQVSQAVPAQVQDASGVRPVYDPCQSHTKQFGSASMTASTQVLTGTAGQKFYFCSWNDQLGGTAQNYAIVEGTGSTCATGISAVGGLSGGITAATGWNVAANGGRTMGDGSSAIAGTTTAGDNVCVLLSGSIQTNFGYSYVIAP